MLKSSFNKMPLQMLEEELNDALEKHRQRAMHIAESTRGISEFTEPEYDRLPVVRLQKIYDNLRFHEASDAYHIPVLPQRTLIPVSEEKPTLKQIYAQL